MAHHLDAALRHQLEIRIFGTEGQIHLDFFRDHIRFWNKSGIDITPTLPANAGVYNCDGTP